MTAGAIESYLKSIPGYLMVFYVFTIFWSVAFPFSYREAKVSGRMKHVKISVSIATVILPFCSLVLLKDGYRPSLYFSNTCVPGNPSMYFYTVALPACIIIWLSISLLLFVMYILFKVVC